MDHGQLMDLAKDGALAREERHYRKLLTEIDSVCGTLQRASVMMVPGALDEIKEAEIALAADKLLLLMPEARALKAKLEKAGIHVW